MRSEEQIEYAPFEAEEYFSGSLELCETESFGSRGWSMIYPVCEGEAS